MTITNKEKKDFWIKAYLTIAASDGVKMKDIPCDWADYALDRFIKMFE